MKKTRIKIINYIRKPRKKIDKIRYSEINKINNIQNELDKIKNNQNYDDGNIIKQYKCRVSEMDTPETLFEKIKELELNYPSVIKSIL